jgi:GntR family transcriptional regulator
MEQLNNSRTHLYRQVEDLLRQEIALGNFKEGDLIPSEQKLGKKYGVSQGTVRKAVLNLTQLGLLYRKQGKGTFVVFQKESKSRFRNFRFVEELNSEQLSIDVVFLNIKVVSAKKDIARYLGIRKGASVIRLERMGKIEDNSIFHTLSYLPKKLYKGLEKYTADDFAKNTLWKLQDIYFGIRIEKREEFLTAVPADKNLARELGTDSGHPLLRIEVKLTAYSGKVVEYRLSHVKLDNFKFYVRLPGMI